jgi:hypothetical protein
MVGGIERRAMLYKASPGGITGSMVAAFQLTVPGPNWTFTFSLASIDPPNNTFQTLAAPDSARTQIFFNDLGPAP